MKNLSKSLTNYPPSNCNFFGFNTTCSKDNLKEIREFLKMNLSIKHILDPTQNQIITAVDEICANSIIHANYENENKCIDIYLKYLENEVEIEIIDKGVFFDFSVYQEPLMQDLISNKQKGSMGLILVKRIMDDIKFSRHNDKNVCKMTKKLS